MTILFLWRIVPWLRRRGTGWGTVYLMRSHRRPGLFKVGFTRRRTKDRRAELNRVGRDDMRIVFTVTMPLARQCERAMLRRLRRSLFRKRDRRGTEWFWLRRRESIDDIAALLHHTARTVRRVGRLKLSWPAGAEIRVFDARRGAAPGRAGQALTRGLAWWAFPVLIGVLTWPEMALAHIPGKTPDLTFLLPFFVALITGLLMGFSPLTPGHRTDKGLNIFLGGIFLFCLALTALLFFEAVEEFHAARTESASPTQMKEIWP